LRAQRVLGRAEGGVPLLRSPRRRAALHGGWLLAGRAGSLLLRVSRRRAAVHGGRLHQVGGRESPPGPARPPPLHSTRRRQALHGGGLHQGGAVGYPALRPARLEPALHRDRLQQGRPWRDAVLRGPRRRPANRGRGGGAISSCRCGGGGERRAQHPGPAFARGASAPISGYHDVRRVNSVVKERR